MLAVAATGAAAPGCPPTVPDALGPFGRGMPPVRASIGKGHVLTGVVVSSLNCRPIRGARVELWQANAKGVYVRALSGTVITDRNGRFRFQGPYPALYEGTPPHIHLRVITPAHEVLLWRFIPAPPCAPGIDHARPRAAGGLGGLGETVLVPRGAAAARGTWRLFRPPSRR